MESLADRGEAANEEDDRNVADLLLDQIEFADVILLNKIDLVGAAERHRLLGLLRTLNPSADIIPTQNSEVDLEAVINTGKFSFEKAARSAGWLQSLQLQAEGGLVPETEEYGIGSFVYRARRPFHPARLHDFMSQHFLLQEPDWRAAMEDDGEDLGAGAVAAAHSALQAAVAAAQEATDALRNLTVGGAVAEAQHPLLTAAVSLAEAASTTLDSATSVLSQLAAPATSSTASHSQPTQATAGHAEISVAEAAPRRERLHAAYGQVLRSKGFVWLASRPELCGEWSQAGGILRFTVGGPWYATLPEEAWPQDPEQRADIKKDFQGPYGDRRQELVFIGIDVRREALGAALDACLVSDEEEREQGGLAGIGPDPFAPWPTLDQILDAGDEDEEGSDVEESAVEHEHHAGCSHGADTSLGTVEQNEGRSQPYGPLIEVFDGAPEVQDCFNEVEAGTPAVVLWHSPWVSSSAQTLTAVRELAERVSGVVFIVLDVDVNVANRAFANEKVMERPNARRQGAKPVVKHGAKWPCITVHHAPSLMPWKTLTGDGAVDQLRAVLTQELGVTVRQVNEEKNVAAGALVAAPGPVHELQNGAAEFKGLLAAGKDSGEAVVVVWTAKSALDHAAAVAIANGVAAQAGGAVVVLADSKASQANATLATALKVQVTPTVLVCRAMKIENKLVGAEVSPQAVLSLLNPTLAVANGCTTSEASSVTASGPPEVSPPKAESPYDPPGGKYARPGATKRMPNGITAHFFPKMPCLRCGCPWWTSDEWNGRCVRCGWDCEKGGYDDDSKPLPAHVKKWEAFTAAIRDGRTPEWRGR